MSESIVIDSECDVFYVFVVYKCAYHQDQNHPRGLDLSPGRLFWPISQIGIQCNMLGFLMEGHICVQIYQSLAALRLVLGQANQEVNRRDMDLVS